MPIGWDEGVPADGDNASAGDDALRSLKTSLAQGLGAFVYWPGSGGGSAASAGVMKPGAARTFYDVESRVSAGQDGQLMYASDTSRLWYVGTTGPSFLGGQYAIESASNPGAGARWHLASGTSYNGGNIPFGVTYGAAPRVIVSIYTGLNEGGMSVVTGITTTGFHCGVYDYLNTIAEAQAWSVYWMSLGTVAI